jgi:class 3 adenylate cyclase/tetratricopeptide (TPR) repeat protein
MGRIFISHSERDLPVAAEIVRGLEGAGYPTWYFERDIVPGTSYITQIALAIEQSQAVVLVVSSNALDSDQVSKEVVGAFERRKPFFPVLVDMTPPQLKERQPEWRHALGSTTMICLSTEGIPSCTARIIEGLKVMGIQPEAAGIGLGVRRRPAPTPAKYTPKHLADKILAARASLEGERKQVTVLFADVKGFTSISERLDPEEVNDLISECMVFLTEEIHRYEGTIAQFLGDGVMALFGAPIAHEDAPQRALYASLGMRDRLREYSRKLKQRGIEFNMRIGLNTGLVVVGKIGDDLTMEYTAMGDTVNLASRMESTAEPGAIQVSENTYRLTEGYFEFKALGDIEVKGKTEPVKAYQLLGLGRVKTRLGVSEMRGLTPFVGRRKELDHLIDCYEQAKRGQGQVVGITGEPGVGKSRLLLQLRSVLPQGEYSYLEGECHHYGDTVAYLPILDILRSYCGIEEGEQEALSRKKLQQRISQLDERLTVMLPPLQELMSLKVEDEQFLRLDPQLKRARIFEAVWSLLIRESQNRPLVLAVEDLQWIDKTSEEFLGYIIARLGGARIMLIILYRPEYSNPWTSKTYYSQIRVDELPLDASAEMVQAILKGGKAAEDLVRLILDRAAGNPLFMEEFTRSLVERGYIERKDGRYVLTVKPSDIQVPETVQGIISARMDRLEKVLKETMQVASVIGKEFAYRVLQVLTGMQDELRAYIFSLQELEFIYEKSLFPELEYMFKHNLTQEVAYNSLLLKRRREIHERTGKAIEELYRDRLEEFYEVLAHHYSRSDNLEKAHEYLKLSVIKAAYGYSIWEAYRFCKEAIQVLNRGPQTQENKRKEIEIRLITAQVMMGLGYPEDYFQVLEEGERLARDLGDEGSVAVFCSAIGRGYSSRGDPAKGIEYGERALEQAEKIGDVALVAPIVSDLCYVYGATANYLKVVELCQKAIALIEKTGTQAESFGQPWNMYAGLLSVNGEVRGYLGDFDTGQDMCEKSIRLATESGNILGLAVSEFSYGWLFVIKGDGENAVKYFQKCTGVFEQTKATFIVGSAYGGLAFGHYYLGDLDNARQRAEAAIEAYTQVSTNLFLSHPYLALVMIHLDSGDLKNARSCVEQALNLAQKNGEKQHEGLSRILLGGILGKEDMSQSDKAQEYILEGIKILEERKIRPYSSWGYLYLGELYADMGRREKALQTLRKAETAFRKMGIDYWLRRTQEVLARVRS